MKKVRVTLLESKHHLLNYCTSPQWQARCKQGVLCSEKNFFVNFAYLFVSCSPLLGPLSVNWGIWVHGARALSYPFPEEHFLMAGSAWKLLYRSSGKHS